MNPNEELVLRALAEKEATSKDIRQVTGLARRTLYLHLKRLVNRGIVRSRPSIKDTRQTLYRLADPSQSVPA